VEKQQRRTTALDPRMDRRLADGNIARRESLEHFSIPSL
jgi:hypothetical protein